MGIFSKLLGKPNWYEWNSIGIINNAGDYRKLSARVPKCILSNLCTNVDLSYGTQIHFANGKTWKYKAVPVGYGWSNLRQGEHGNNSTEIEIFRRLR